MSDISILEIDGTEYSIEDTTARSGMSIANPILIGTETELESIQIGNTKYKVPEGDTVSWTQLTISGTKIAQLVINGTPTDVYAPTSGGGGGVTSLGQLDDVVLSTITAGDNLTYDSTTGKWKNKAFDNVIANPTLIGTESDLTALQISGIKYAIPQGSIVEFSGVIQSGTKIATITIDSIPYDIYIPEYYTKLEIDSALSAKADSSDIPTQLSQLSDDTTHRVVTDTEKSTWNSKAGTSVATSSANGLMSSTDKSKLDGIAASAQVNVLEGVQIDGTDLSISGKKVNIPQATSNSLGIVKPDGTTITVDLDGTIHSAGGGSSSGYNPNLLINPNFKVNTTNKTSWTTIGALMDGWQLLGYNATVDMLDGGGISISNSVGNKPSVSQVIPVDVINELLGKTVTISICYYTTASDDRIRLLVYGNDTSVGKYINVVSNTWTVASVTVTIPSSIASPTYLRIYTNHDKLDGTEYKIKWVKLELGTTATPFIVPNEYEELVKCIGVVDKSTVESHMSNSNIHVTNAEKSTWNGKTKDLTVTSSDFTTEDDVLLYVLNNSPAHSTVTFSVTWTGRRNYTGVMFRTYSTSATVLYLIGETQKIYQAVISGGTVTTKTEYEPYTKAEIVQDVLDALPTAESEVY